jgi:hypothetical protein
MPKTLISGAERLQVTFRHWTYAALELQGMLQEAGFGPINMVDGVQGGPYDHNASRLAAVAVRPVAAGAQEMGQGASLDGLANKL